MLYSPPFTITDEILKLVAEIPELLRVIEADVIYAKADKVRLRKENRIKTIHSTLAIENNSMSIEQITAIVDGKRVIGSLDEIREVKNAISVYESLFSFEPYGENDLLKVHQIMMTGLVDKNGKYRIKCFNLL